MLSSQCDNSELMIRAQCVTQRTLQSKSSLSSSHHLLWGFNAAFDSILRSLVPDRGDRTSDSSAGAAAGGCVANTLALEVLRRNRPPAMAG